MANRTPFGLALSMQREAIRQGQRTVEQGMNAQQAMTEAFVHNAIGMGRAANRNATEASRQGVVTVAGMLDAMVPAGADSATTINQGFDSALEVQENAWRIFEQSAEDGLVAYSQLAENGMEMFSESVDATMAAQREVGRRSADAAVEYERQRPEHHATGGAQTETTPTTPSEAEPVDIEPEEAGEPSTEADESGTEAEEPSAEAGEPATESEEPTAGPPLEDLAGVGAAYADRLRAAGVDSLESLREADVAALSEETEISDERLENWQRQARNMLEEE